MNVRHQSALLCLWVWLLALAPFQVVHAQSNDRITAAEFGRLWGPALDSAGATQVRNYPVGPSYSVTTAPTISAETGGGLSVSKSAKFPVDPSSVIDVTAKAQITRAAMGKAFKTAVALGGGPLGLAFFAASEIADWMKQANLRQSPTAPGTFEVKDPGSCTVAPCYQYQLANSNYPWFNSMEAACTHYVTYIQTSYICSRYDYSQNYFWLIEKSSGREVAGGHCYTRSRTPDATAVYLPASPTQIESAASTPTMKPEWLTRVLDSGTAVDASLPTLSGPSTAAGPTSTSTKQIKDAQGNVTGTQTINKSTTYNITYAGNTYNVNSVTNTTTINPDGTSSTETQTEAKPADKPAPSDCDKYPDSVGCVSLGSPTSDKLNAKSQPVSVVAASFASSAACPAPLAFAVAARTYSISYQPMCDRLAILRVLFLAMAGVIAAYILADSFRVQ